MVVPGALVLWVSKIGVFQTLEILGDGGDRDVILRLTGCLLDEWQQLASVVPGRVV